MILKAIEEAKSTISQIKLKYNVSEAESILSEAEEAFNRGEYLKAKEFALKAKQKAIEIKKIAQPAEKAIEEAKSIISQIKPKYNVKEAESLLSQAEEAFKAGKYKEAYSYALKAKSFALDIDQDGVPNEVDFAPYINNYYIYASGVAIMLILVFSGKKYYTYRKRKKEELEWEKSEIISQLEELLK